MNKIKQIINNLAVKIGMDEIFEEPFNPYCQRCDSCGHEGCCSPTSCDMGEGCDYGESYLLDLKYNYTSLKRLIVVMYQDKERYSDLLEELGRISDEEYDKWYGE